ncbi:drug/metabolite transporter (DMT)-like permease [Luteimonas cucumeris]|uniref:Drug/metabolite transporter (DMT)-like permease n=1 Tax=Luteimonas cucumeris TaxID=985012 RepID=A0A562L2F1_9GAMM|nr:drug/metabolite exporter YedA [Luteimonas cucumeris]TWI01811.1 drug/metabolite transporter (DMT)-like permease [Luteimonas cucumeris]
MISPHTSSSPAMPRGLAIGLALAAVYVIWGSTYLGIRLALEGGFPPLLMAGGRFLVAGAMMYVVLRWRGVPTPTRAQWKNLAVMGFLMMGLGNGMVTLAEQWVSSGLAAVAVASAPLWIGLFASLRGQHPRRLEWIGLGIGFIGVVWLNAGSSLVGSPKGLVALLIAPLAWAFGSIWSRGRDMPSPFMSASGQMLCGGAMMLAAGFATGESFDGVPTLKGMLAVAYLMTFGSIIGFTAYIWLLDHVRPTLAGSYAYVNPVIAVMLGAWLAAERFTSHDLGAMGVILLGVVAITLAKARAPKTAASPAPTADESA